MKYIKETFFLDDRNAVKEVRKKCFPLISLTDVYLVILSKRK